MNTENVSDYNIITEKRNWFVIGLCIHWAVYEKDNTFNGKLIYLTVEKCNLFNFFLWGLNCTLRNLMEFVSIARKIIKSIPLL